jgi:chorismate mutase-like protein
MTNAAFSPEEVRRLLAEHRARIDTIDLQLVELLNRRAAAAAEIGRAKQAAGMAVYEPKREDDVYHNVLAANAGPLSGDALKRIFERIIDEMRSLQRLRADQDRKRAKGEA